MNLEKKDFILLGILVLIVLGLFFIVRRDDEKENNEQGSSTVKETLLLVGEKSTFFTVESCANRYLTSLRQGNAEDLMKLVDKEYIDNHNLNKSNIVKHLGALEGIYTLKAKKMVYKKNKNITKYYIYGILKEDSINNYDKGSDYYLIVNIDNKKDLFSIEPYDGAYFKEVYSEREH